MCAKVDVLYCRFSTELQRTESNADQERRCRDGLDRRGIDHSRFTVIADEAISGESEDRPGFKQLKKLIYSGRLGLLVVSEQSRLSRGDNAKGLIKDIVFHGGRFISVSEGIDTAQKGWKTLVGLNEIHHARSNEDTAERVRGGQEGRVHDGNGSAGDFPFGYRSEFADPAAAAAYRGRGPKPKKMVVIDEPQAEVVREIFRRFVAQQSITSIVQWLNSIRHSIPRIGNRRGKGLWHHEHVRRILTNRKYVGEWSYGRTTTLRDQYGNKKQVPARPDQRVTSVMRPSLRIIEQQIWEAAQARLRELLTIYGMKEGHKRRGPAAAYRNHYRKRLLNGKVHCERCGSVLTDSSNNTVKRLGCPQHRAGVCPVASRVPVAFAEQAVLGVVAGLLTNYAAWIDVAVGEMRAVITEKLRSLPNERDAVNRDLARVQAEIGNLLNLAASGVSSSSLTQRLAELEDTKKNLEQRATQLAHLDSKAHDFPSDEWIKAEFAQLADVLRDLAPDGVHVLGSLLGPITAEEVKSPGKARGFMRLRFRLHAWPVLKQVLSPKLPTALLELAAPSAVDGSDEFVVDCGRPSRMDRWAPQIVEWREQGVPWKEIVRRTGLKLANAYVAFKRHRDATQKAA